jgi:hypothetical protein
VELRREAGRAQVLQDRVDAVRHDERGAGGFLREEVAQRPIERPRHPHRLAVPGDEREGAADPRDVLGRAARDAGARLLERHVRDAVDGRVGEVVDAVKSVVTGHAALLRSVSREPRRRDGVGLRLTLTAYDPKLSARTAVKRVNPLQ